MILRMIIRMAAFVVLACFVIVQPHLAWHITRDIGTFPVEAARYITHLFASI